MCCASHLFSLIVSVVPLFSPPTFYVVMRNSFFLFLFMWEITFGKTAWHVHFLHKLCVYLGLSGVPFSCLYSPPACFVYPVFLHISANIEEHDDEAERLGWREGYMCCGSGSS